MLTTLTDYQILARRLLATCLLLVAGWGHAVESASPQANRTILIIGDSLSAGYGLAASDAGWVDLLARSLSDYKVINASISGDTLAGGLARLPRLLEEHKPRWLVIELGGNDGLRGHSLATIRDQLSKLIALGQAAGAEVLVMEMRIPPNYGKRYTQKFTAVFREQAGEMNATLIPFFLEKIALQAGMMQGDGIHPTALAQTHMRDQVLNQLEPLLSRARGD